MIQPYASAIADFEETFQGLGFRCIDEGPYKTVFSDGQQRIEISTERYNHPSSMMTTLIDQTGKARSFAIIQEMLDPNAFEGFKRALSAIEDKHNFQKTPVAELLRNGAAYEYAHVVVGQLVAFIHDHRAQIQELPTTYAQQYDGIENAWLARHGIQQNLR